MGRAEFFGPPYTIQGWHCLLHHCADTVMSILFDYIYHTRDLGGGYDQSVTRAGCTFLDLAKNNALGWLERPKSDYYVVALRFPEPERPHESCTH